MGPTCEVLIPRDDLEALITIDKFLASHFHQIERTRKGRVWSIVLDGQCVQVNVLESPPSIQLAAAQKSPADYELLRTLAKGLADELDGIASEPIK